MVDQHWEIFMTTDHVYVFIVYTQSDTLAYAHTHTHHIHLINVLRKEKCTQDTPVTQSANIKIVSQTE